MRVSARGESVCLVGLGWVLTLHFKLKKVICNKSLAEEQIRS